MRRILFCLSIFMLGYLAAPVQAQETTDAVEQCLALKDADNFCKAGFDALRRSVTLCGGRDCRRECKSVKKDCKSDCKDAKRSCFALCDGMSGREKRACKDICRNTIDQCVDRCKSTGTVCRTECQRRDPRNCRQAGDEMIGTIFLGPLCFIELVDGDRACDEIVFSEEELEGVSTD